MGIHNHNKYIPNWSLWIWIMELTLNRCNHFGIFSIIFGKLNIFSNNFS
jgi:hypothetical protein